jgi:biopolymer transport protein ExbB
MSVAQFFSNTDTVGVAVALLLLAMSVASWVVIVLKAWSLRRARRNIIRAVAAFWQAPDLLQGQQAATGFDREQWLAPLLEVVQHQKAPMQTQQDVGHAHQRHARVTRLLRDAKTNTLHQLEFGQVLLATVGSTAPFVGLLGTVWGIYHALSAIAGAGLISIDKVAGPVGEALVMTAAGLAVALPAVLAYNVFGRQIAQIADKLDGFAFDLRETLCD